jgi:hypothetical protein
MRHLPVLFAAIALAACSTGPGRSNATPAARPARALASEQNELSRDSIAHFLLTAAATDFHIHGPSGHLRFREVRMGYVVTPDSGKQYILCGQFLRMEEGGTSEWMHFATIKTSGYEQWIGGHALGFCQDSLVIWDNAGDLSPSLQTRFDSLR